MSDFFLQKESESNLFGKNYSLSILLQKDKLSFLIVEDKLKEIVSYQSFSFHAEHDSEDYCFEIKKILKKTSVFSLDYAKTRILIDSYNTTVVPEALYKEEETQNLFNLNFDIFEEKILCNKISNLSIYNCYSIPFCLHELLTSFFEKASLHSSSTPILQNLSQENKASNIILYFSKRHFDIFYFKDKKLQMTNNFFFKTKEDLLYYLLLAFEQLELSPKEQEVTILGDINPKDIEFDFLQDFFEKIQFSNQKIYNTDLLKEKVAPHFYHNLLSVLQCE